MSRYCTKEQLMSISKINFWGKILAESIINTDNNLRYLMILNGYTHHHRVLYHNNLLAKNEFAKRLSNGKNHTNKIIQTK